MIRILFCLLLPIFCVAQLDERVAPRDFSKEKRTKNLFPEDATDEGTDSDSEIIPKTQGLILTKPGMKFLPGELSRVKGVEIIDLNIPGDTEKLKKKLLPLFMNKPLSMKKISEIKRAIVEYYRSVDHPVLYVSVPEQDVTEGVLMLYILEAKIGKVGVDGNKWFSSEKLREYVRLQEDQDIDSSYLTQDLYWINRNPFRDASVVLKPGELEGTTDVEFWVKDRLPLRFYAGIENTGFKETGRGRLFGGVQWGNAFGADQILSYQYTSSTDFGKFHAHTGHWTIPVHRFRQVLEFFGGYSKVEPDMPIGFGSTGRSWQVSGRYTIPLVPTRKYIHEVKTGVDWKRTNNNIFFALAPIVANTVQITQLMGGYNGTYNAGFNKTSFDVELYWSPGDLFAHQSNSDYQQLRPFAKSAYAYIRGHAFTILQLDKSFSWSLNTQFQAATTNLLPTEQFGIGGYSTVRGYEEREVNVDNAFLASSEIRTPPFSVLKIFRENTKVQDVFQFLVFLDYGVGSFHQTIPGQNKTEYLLGVGPGARYNIDVNLSFRADLGWKLHKTQANPNAPAKRFHFSFLLSY